MRHFNLFRKKTEKQRNIKLVLLIAVFGFITGFLIISPSTKAATFDSDLLPDATNSRNIGTLTGALKTWKNLFLTGVLSLGTATDAQETGVTTATGGLYFNTTGNNLKVYNGTTWQNVGSSHTPWMQNISAGGFTLFGNSTASGVLTLDSTSHATKGNIILNSTSGNVGIGLATTPGAKLDVAGGVKLANDTGTCDSTKAGTLRWTGTNFSGCNGTTWVAYVTLPTPIEYLVIGGGGGSGYSYSGAERGGGGGGAGGFRTNVSGATSGANSAAEAALSATPGTQYTVTVGAGGAGLTGGAASVFGSITSLGGGRGGYVQTGATNGGSGGGRLHLYDSGAAPADQQLAGSGTASQGFAGGQGDHGLYQGLTYVVGGNGGGASATNGFGLCSSITGTAVGYAGGGQGSGYHNFGPTWLASGISATPGRYNCAYEDVGTGGVDFGLGAAGAGGVGTAGGINKGGGGGAGNGVGSASAGGSGVVIIAYPDTYPALTTIAAGLTYSVSTSSRPGYRVYTFTAGTGTITI